MKFPEDVREILTRRYQNKRCEWLRESNKQSWSLEISLGIPTEQEALQQPEEVRRWVVAWQAWLGVGTLVWSERRWKVLGTQRVPEKLSLKTSEDVSIWVGEQEGWRRANTRYQTLIERWPPLATKVLNYFDELAFYSETDFQRLFQMLQWINANPNSNLYPRQLPIAGIDSKWLEGRKKFIGDLISSIQGETLKKDFFQQCGLKAPPYLIRLRVLDSSLRGHVGGLCDITAAWEELAILDLPVARVFIVENLQTGLAFTDMPASVVVMGLGYSVEVLACIPWLANAKCIYWGDLDTHGFAILNRARSHLPHVQSILMDRSTLLKHSELWVQEKEQHSSNKLELLFDDEQALYQGLKQQEWGQYVRLEQERIDWNYAFQILQST